MLSLRLKKNHSTPQPKTNKACGLALKLQDSA
jgi:hypothetical protein